MATSQFSSSEHLQSIKVGISLRNCVWKFAKNKLLLDKWKFCINVIIQSELESLAGWDFLFRNGQVLRLASYRCWRADQVISQETNQVKGGVKDRISSWRVNPDKTISAEQVRNEPGRRMDGNLWATSGWRSNSNCKWWHSRKRSELINHRCLLTFTVRHSYLLCHTTHKGKTGPPPPQLWLTFGRDFLFPLLGGGGPLSLQNRRAWRITSCCLQSVCDILRLVTVKFQWEPSGVRCSEEPSAPGSDCCRDTFCLSDLKWCFLVFCFFLS